MNDSDRWLVRFYRRVLQLYPSGFRDDYQQEMVCVFELQVAEKQPDSFWEVLQFCWRELRDLPGLLATAYLRERRQKRMSVKLEKRFSQPKGSWNEFFLASLPFILVMLLPSILSMIPALKDIGEPVGWLVLGVFAVTLIGLSIIGFLVSLPRWSLAYVGIMLTVLAYLVAIGLDFYRIFSFLQKWTLGITIGYLTGFLVVLFAMVVVMVLAAGQLRLTLPLIQNIRADRTLLSFMLYCGSLVFVVLSYDEVKVSIFPLLSALALLTGAWWYLRVGTTNARLMSLLFGNTLAILFSLVANGLYSVLRVETLVSIGQIEVSHTMASIILVWFACLMMIFIPFWARFPGKLDKFLAPGNG
jgi:hypothetical protein